VAAQECSVVSAQRAGNAGRHCCQVGRPCHCHVGERVHHPPNRTEQSEERRAADRRRQQDHLRFEFERGFPNSALHCCTHRVHLRRRNFVGDTKTSSKSFVHFRGTEQMKG